MADDEFHFEINDQLDLGKARNVFSSLHRVQIRNVLTSESAEYLREVLANKTKWGLAWRAAEEGPNNFRHEDLEAMSPEERNALDTKASAAVGDGRHGFLYSQYPMLEAYLGGWDPDHPLDQLLEQLNSEAFLSLVRQATGIGSVIKASAQATCFGPGHFLTEHDDLHDTEPRRVAYVLNLGLDDWKSEWGGFLNFFDAGGNIELGLKPLFNSLNMFRVPQRHSVSCVAPFAPVGRYAITGWAMDPDG